MTEKEFLARWIMHYIHPEYFYIPWGSGGTPPQPYILIEKTVTENGTYDPADDDADGYSKVTVTVGNVIPLTVTENGYYECWDYDCDGFCPVTVDVPSDFTFCSEIEIDDIVNIVDPEQVEEDDEFTGTYINDEEFEGTFVCSISNDRHYLWVGIVWDNGYQTKLYDNRSELFFAFANASIVDSSAGTFSVTYAFTFDTSRTTTITRTRTEMIGYGEAGHTFKAKRVSWWV